ncbi:unnamed protein product, partial [Effrenium voratum]
MVAALFLVLCLILAGVCLLYHFLRRRLKVPPLVDETSVACCRRRKVGDVRTVFGGDEGRPEVVLADDVRQTVEDMALVALARSARGRKASDLQALPNAIFYGGPGTGKSLTARRLAEACGMDYAIMSGGNVLGLQEEAVPELRRVFGWARRCRKGLLLFIDEAEAFLCCRSKQSNAFLQAAVSFFLSQTGSSSSCLLLILATNRVEDLDAAVLSRMPQHLEFRAPSAQLLEKQVADRQRRLEPKAAERLLSLLKGRGDLGQVLRGFSGRDVQSLFEEFARRWSLEQESGQQRKADAAWLERYFQHRLGEIGAFRARWGRLAGSDLDILRLDSGFDVLDKINDSMVDEKFAPFQNIRIWHTEILEDPFDDPEGLAELIPPKSPEVVQDEVLKPIENEGDEAELQERMAKTLAKSQATSLELLHDLPDADIAPPDTDLFVAKLNPVTQDGDLELIFSR